MFKRVVFRDTIPKTGWMTSAKWLDIPTEWVYFHDMVATQPGVYFKALIENAPPVSGDIYPHIVRVMGQNYLQDGHTRAVRSMIEGKIGMTCRVLHLDDDNDSMSWQRYEVEG